MLVLQARRHPVISFFVLSYALAWVLVALVPVSLVFGFVALFGPAAAALLVAAATEGHQGVRELLGRLAIWRVGAGWYAVALGLPALLSILAVGLGIALGAPRSLAFSDVSGLTLLLFVLVVGEELGWRGYALPRLITQVGPLRASLLLGLAWAGWHLPNQFIPGLEAYGYGFPAFASYVVGMTILFTALAMRTSGSLLLSWLFHGAINGLVFINPALPIAERWWHNAAVYGLAAAIAVLVLRLSPVDEARVRLQSLR